MEAKEVESVTKDLSTYERAKGVEFDGEYATRLPFEMYVLMRMPIPDTLLPEWANLPLHPLLKKGLYKLGFTMPTAIQRQAVPMAINGTVVASGEDDSASDEDAEIDSKPSGPRDVVGVAETVSFSRDHSIVRMQLKWSSPRVPVKPSPTLFPS